MRRLALLACCCVPAYLGADVVVIPHILEVNGKPVGTAVRVTGGVRSTMPTPSSGYEPLNIEFEPSSNEPLLELIADSFNRPFGRDQDVWTITQGDGKSSRKREFVEAHLTSLSLPLLDRTSKAPGYLGSELTFGKKSEVTVQGWDYKPKQQKQWLCSNFRVSMGTLNSSRISKVHAFTIKMKLTDVDGDGRPESSFASSPILMELPYEDSAGFQEWFQSTLEGRGYPVPVKFTLADSSGDLANIEIEMRITSLDFPNPFDVLVSGKETVQVGGTMTERAPKIDLNP